MGFHHLDDVSNPSSTAFLAYLQDVMDVICLSSPDVSMTLVSYPDVLMTWQLEASGSNSEFF